ncbi:MAG: amidohydrolase family protein [Phycisphaerales bacterium JB037]
MIIAGWLMLPDEGRSVRLELGFIEVRDGHITEVELGDPVFMPDRGGPGTIICPGFIDAHVHLPQFPCIGAHGMELLDWLARVIFPAEARWEDAAVAAAQAEASIRAMLSFGTTSFAAYATVHHAGARAAIRVGHEFGVRAMIGQVLMDREAPAELIRPAEQLLEEASQLRGLGRVEAAITPRFAISCTPELLAGAGRLSAELRAPIQTHLAETERECERVTELFGGTRYAKIYDEAGLLNDRTILGHGIRLDEEDRGLLRARGSVIAHCPTANLFLGAGSLDRAATDKAGVRLALGSDVAGGPDRSMVRVARAMLETARWRDDAAPSPGECWWQITAGNAGALGFADAGRLATGQPADLVLIEPDAPLGLGAEGATDPRDPLAALLYGWDDRWVRRTLVRGEVVYSAPGA